MKYPQIYPQTHGHQITAGLVWSAAPLSLFLTLFMISGILLGVSAPASAQTTPQTLTVEADQHLEWRRDDQQYIAKGNAVLTTQDMTLKADTITADYTNVAETD